MTGPDGRINLSRITLYTCFWGGDVSRLHQACRVLRFCQREYHFGRTILLTSAAPPTDFPHEVIQIPTLTSIGQWNLFVNRVLPSLLPGEFVMSVHEDGFPIEPRLWDDRFLEYDYIGAPWEDGVVGNAGFSIESRKLLNAKLKLPTDFSLPVVPSDYLICRKYRRHLEGMGIRFAPAGLALRFSTESTGRLHSSFGFHGRIRSRRKYQLGWQKIQKLEWKAEQKNIISQFTAILDPKKASVVYEPSAGFRKILDEFDSEFARRRTTTWLASAEFVLRLGERQLVETGCFHGTTSDGASTLLLAQLAKDTHGRLDSYELSPQNIAIAKTELRRRGLDRFVEFHQGDSVTGLASRKESIGFIYLDSYDCGLGPDFSPCQKHQLSELEAALPLLKRQAGVLLDDSMGEVGKTAMSEKRMLSLPFQKLAVGHQVFYYTGNSRRLIPSRFCVVTGHLENFGPLAVKTVYRNKAEYCLWHGHQLKVHRTIDPAYYQPGSHANGHSWSRFAYLLHLVESGMFEWVWCVGCDTLITNFSKTLGEVVKLAERVVPLPKLKMARPKQAPPNVITRWDALGTLKPDGQSHLIVCGDRGSPVQADSFLVRCGPNGAAFLRDILSFYNTYKRHPWVENQAMIDLYTRYASITNILPQHVMNSYDYSLFHHLDPIYKEGVDCHGFRGQWQKGDFLIHWPATSLQKRLELVQQYEPMIVY
jgi:hypothetical protein